ncbi:MotA/TolQ/ExbB proton channel family protein [Vibrio palustris]|uniref:Biopolymer transport protein ExbB n=1 Tax=Vibrio palustris TaxID=1918946 RepID=A0A1R4B2K1_9VIBR|nr:MotA/TolQ/ExbB proton channel family protein [Vibrio palustris]SJL83144.1 Biopolymer transport protein ExbB [Vibrio palustris]
MTVKSLITLITLAGVTATASFTTQAADDLSVKAKTEQRQQQAHNKHREHDFKAQERKLKKQKLQLAALRDRLQKQADNLSQTFSQNEDKLAKREEKLRLATGSLGEVFGVVRQNAKEVQQDLANSVTGVDGQHNAQLVDAIVAAKSLPSMPQLTGLWHAMQAQIEASGHIAPVTIDYVNGEGKTVKTKAVRLGALALLTDQGYVNWNNTEHDALGYDRQPENGPTLSSADDVLQGHVNMMTLDPSQGTLIKQLANEPTLMDRIKAGGAVGNVIIALLVIGLGIAGYRGILLTIARRQINHQLQHPETLTDNPLGRVLSVYNKEKQRSVEALELRLLEVVVDEQAQLERGLSMLKLLAALAPMLGLLGTVTGMIETFQVITQFGNGDPKVMAGGISMALITTVLGLVAAIPLLLSHNVLSSQSEIIRNILEKQGIGMVAEQAEKDGLAAQTA